MSNLRSRVVRLAHARPDLRPHLLPILAAGPDLEDMRLRLEAILDEQERLVEESRAFGVRLAAVGVPEGTMPFAKMVKIREDFQKNTEELERFIRINSRQWGQPELRGEAKALLDRAKAKLAEFKAQRDKADEAFAAYAEAYQANDLKTLMDDIESWVRKSVGPKIKVERKHKYMLNKGEVLAQLMVERPGVWGPGTTVRVTLKSKAGSPNYLLSLYNYERHRDEAELRVSKKSRHEVVRKVIDALLDLELLEESESKSDLLPALRKAMPEVEKGILSAMTARQPYVYWDKPHDALDPEGNPAVESRFKLTAGYNIEVTLMMSGAGTFGRVRFREPGRHHVSYAGPWFTVLALQETTVQALARTATRFILEQDTIRGLGLVKYEPTQGGVVDIDELRRQYTSSAAVYMVDPGVANPRSGIVGVERPVTFKGYAFFGRGVTYHGHSDAYYGQLLKTRSGWVFEYKGTKTPVGNNGDVVKLLKMKDRDERRSLDEAYLSSN